MPQRAKILAQALQAVARGGQPHVAALPQVLSQGDSSNAWPQSELDDAPGFGSSNAMLRQPAWLGPGWPALAGHLQPAGTSSSIWAAPQEQQSAQQHKGAQPLPLKQQAEGVRGSDAAARTASDQVPRAPPTPAARAPLRALEAPVPRAMGHPSASPMSVAASVMSRPLPSAFALSAPQRGGRGAAPSGIPPARPSASSVLLNKQIMSCRSVGELHALVRERGHRFDFFNCSSSLSRVPKLVGSAGAGASLDAAAKALLDDLAALMEAQLRAFDARGLANAAWAFAKLKYVPSPALPARIAAAAAPKLGEMCPQNLSNLVWALVYLRHHDEVLMEAAAVQVMQKLGQFKPQELANVMWAFASMDHDNPELVAAVARRAVRMAADFNEQELSNLVWSFGKLRYQDPALWAALLEAVDVQLPHLMPQGVSNIMWALANVGRLDAALMDRLVVHCLAHVGAYDVQALANCLWAAAVADYANPAFVNTLALEAAARCERMSPQNLSNVVWALASLGCDVDSDALAALAEAAAHKVDSFDPQCLANIMWGFARIGGAPPSLHAALTEAAMAHADAFAPAALVTLARALADGRQYDERAFRTIARRATEAVSMDAAQLAAVARALACARHHDDSLMSTLLQQLVASATAGTLDAGALAGGLWAAARMGHALGAAGPTLVAAARSLLPAMGPQQLSDTVWALGVLNLLDQDLWERYCDRMGTAAVMAGASHDVLHQAFEAQLLYQSSRGCSSANGSAVSADGDGLPMPLKLLAQQAWLQCEVASHCPNLLADVSTALALAGVPSEPGWVTDDGLFMLQLAFELNGEPVAVEVRSAQDYAANDPTRPLADAGVRRRLLRSRGWRVVSVNEEEWRALPGGPLAKGAALLQLLGAELGPAEWQWVGPPRRGAADNEVAAVNARSGVLAAAAQPADEAFPALHDLYTSGDAELSLAVVGAGGRGLLSGMRLASIYSPWDSQAT